MKSAKQIAVEIDTMNEQIEIARAANHTSYNMLSDSLGKSAPAEYSTGQDTGRYSMNQEKMLTGTRIAVENSRVVTRYTELKQFLDTMDIGLAQSVIETIPPTGRDRNTRVS